MEVLRGFVTGHPVALGVAVGAVIAASTAWFVYSRRRGARRDL